MASIWIRWKSGQLSPDGILEGLKDLGVLPIPQSGVDGTSLLVVFVTCYICLDISPDWQLIFISDFLFILFYLYYFYIVSHPKLSWIWPTLKLN